MRRWILHIFAGISLMICIACAFLWVSSQNHGVEVRSMVSERRYAVAAFKGRLNFSWFDGTLTQVDVWSDEYLSRTVVTYPINAIGRSDGRPYLSSNVMYNKKRSWGSFEIERGSWAICRVIGDGAQLRPTKLGYWSLRIPFWALLICPRETLRERSRRN